jgi:hypothetical protein
MADKFNDESGEITRQEEQFADLEGQVLDLDIKIDAQILAKNQRNELRTKLDETFHKVHDDAAVQDALTERLIHHIAPEMLLNVKPFEDSLVCIPQGSKYPNPNELIERARNGDWESDNACWEKTVLVTRFVQPTRLCDMSAGEIAQALEPGYANSTKKRRRTTADDIMKYAFTRDRTDPIEVQFADLKKRRAKQSEEEKKNEE